MKSNQKRDTFHDSRLKTWKNAIHSTNCNKKTRKTRCFYTTKFHLHRKIAIFKENRWMYRVFRGLRCQTRCKTTVFRWESRFYTVFGSATPNLRDTFIDFLRKSRFYDVNKIRTHQKARVLRVFLLQFVECIAFFRVFRRESWNVSRFCLLFIGFLPFSKGILCKSIIFRSPASRRLGLERPGLQKSSISFEFLSKIDGFSTPGFSVSASQLTDQ